MPNIHKSRRIGEVDHHESRFATAEDNYQIMRRPGADGGRVFPHHAQVQTYNTARVTDWELRRLSPPKFIKLTLDHPVRQPATLRRSPPM